LLSPVPVMQWFFRIYVEFFRGTPMLVQLFIRVRPLVDKKREKC